MIGQVINDNYTIQDHLGNGGFSDVWLAIENTTGKKVALKIIHKKLAAGQKFRERFKHSAEILKRLSHQNIVSFIDIIDTPTTLAIVLEYIDGISLEEFILKNYDPATPLKLLPFFLQILEALDYAHRRKIVHRDIKPSNILINKQLIAKLIDFDMLKDFNTDSQFTTTPFTIGTFTFISPEQLENSRDVSLHSDIYSSGLVLFYLLVGRPFFNKNANYSPSELVNIIANENLSPISLINKNIPQVFDNILAKATEKKPGNRFQSCGDLREHIINQTDPYGEFGRVDIDKTMFNPKTLPKASPFDADKTIINKKTEVFMDDKTQLMDDKTQLFDKEKTWVNEDWRTTDTNKTLLFSDEKTIVFNDNDTRIDPYNFFEKLDERVEYEVKKGRTLGLSTWDIVFLVGCAIVFVTGIVVLLMRK